jgi:hypothetical protein
MIFMQGKWKAHLSCTFPPNNAVAHKHKAEKQITGNVIFPFALSARSLAAASETSL